MSASEHADVQARPQADRALYLYGLARPGTVGPLSVPGVSGAADVRTLELGQLTAVYSPLAMEEFMGPDGADHSQDLEWVAPRALRHEQVVEEVMRTTPVLPVRFGVVFSSPEALAEAFRSHQQQIREFLDDIADKEEWAVKVYADARRLREHLEQEPEFRQQLERLPQAPGARYLQEKRLRRALEERSHHEGSRLAARIREELAPLVIAVKPLRLAERRVTGRQDDMVLNCALLAQSGQVERLNQRVQELADQYRQHGLTVETTGPWPPYNFSPTLGERP